nr:MAG TPA: hypothetical protein [Caudoviricetes sp.]
MAVTILFLSNGTVDPSRLITFSIDPPYVFLDFSFHTFFVQLHDGEDTVVTKVQQRVADALIDLGLCALGQIEQAMVFVTDLGYGGDKAKAAELLPCSGKTVAVVVILFAECVIHGTDDLLELFAFGHVKTSLQVQKIAEEPADDKIENGCNHGFEDCKQDDNSLVGNVITVILGAGAVYDAFDCLCCLCFAFAAKECLDGKKQTVRLQPCESGQADNGHKPVPDG